MLRPIGALVLSLLFPFAAKSDEPLRLKETFAVAQQFRVQSRMRGSDNTLAAVKDKDNKDDKAPRKHDDSDIDYVERVLELDGDGLPNRLLRVYDKVEFRRKIGEERMETTVREAARRMVVLREKNLEVPFSPDGPLLRSEIEVVRVDVFTPALAGLLPADAVKPGDTWKAAESAVRELTDIQPEDGSLACKFVEVTTFVGRKVAHVSVRGHVRGVNEDGPTRHEIDGHFFFDLQSQHLCYLSIKGRQLLLDKDGKEIGASEGTLTMTRQARLRHDKLGDDVCGRLQLTPDADNTLLLFEDDDIGVRFVYPRRWRFAGLQNRQVMLEADGGNGILLTPVPLKEVPSPAQFAKEAQELIKSQGDLVLGISPARRVSSAPDVDQFTIEVKHLGKPQLIDYYTVRLRTTGATAATTLNPSDARELRPEIERMMRGLNVTK